MLQKRSREKKISGYEILKATRFLRTIDPILKTKLKRKWRFSAKIQIPSPRWEAKCEIIFVGWKIEKYAVIIQGEIEMSRYIIITCANKTIPLCSNTIFSFTYNLHFSVLNLM